MGIIKTCSEYLRESFWDEMKKKMDGGEEDSLTQRRKEIFEKICDELKRADLFDYASYAEMIKLNEDDGILADFFDDETDDEEYLSQEVGWFAYQDLTCDCGFDPDFEWVRLQYFVICSGVRNGESNDDSYDIMVKFYPYTYNEDENENEDGDFGLLMYDKVKDTWFYGANYDGELQKGDINSVVADTLSIATMAVNPNTKYRRSWFEEKDRTYEDLKNRKCTINKLYNYLIKNYEPLGGKKITYDNDLLEIPVTLTDKPMDVIPDGNFDHNQYIFCVECPERLKKYVEKLTVCDDYEEPYEGYIRVFVYPENDDEINMYCNSVVDILDELLSLVPNPALKKIGK